MKPVVFIQSNAMNWVAAKVSEYAIKKATRHLDRFDVRILRLEDYPVLHGRHGHFYKHDYGINGIGRWRNDYSQSFVPLRFLPPQLMRYEGRALVIDPDVFAISDVSELITRDMQGKAIVCRKVGPSRTGRKPGRRPYYSLGVMLLDCSKLKHWQWDQQIEDMFHFKRALIPWRSFWLEPEENIGLLEEEWNHLDTLNGRTKLLHYTRRSTQPWMTGLPYDRLPRKHEKKAWGIVPKPWVDGMKSFFKGEGYLPYGRYQKHSDPNQEKFFFSLLKECVEQGILTENLLRTEIQKKHIRPDTFALLKSLHRRIDKNPQKPSFRREEPVATF